jgi:hypothetical protein
MVSRDGAAQRPVHSTDSRPLRSALSVKLKEGSLRSLSRNASKLVRQAGIGRGRGPGAAPGTLAGASASVSRPTTPSSMAPTQRSASSAARR